VKFAQRVIYQQRRRKKGEKFKPFRVHFPNSFIEAYSSKFNWKSNFINFQLKENSKPILIVIFSEFSFKMRLFILFFFAFILPLANANISGYGEVAGEGPAAAAPAAAPPPECDDSTSEAKANGPNPFCVYPALVGVSFFMPISKFNIFYLISGPSIFWQTAW
jgi:hypothetical protein